MLAFTCGDPGHPVNAIPPEATAWVQLRHVTGLDADRLGDHLRAHLAGQGYGDVEVSEDSAAFPATATPPDHPAARFAARSIEATTGSPPVILPSLGGSLPNDVFTDTLGLPTIWVPHSYPGCSQHAPDEHLPTAIFAECLRGHGGPLLGSRNRGGAQPSVRVSIFQRGTDLSRLRKARDHQPMSRARRPSISSAWRARRSSSPMDSAVAIASAVWSRS